MTMHIWIHLVVSLNCLWVNMGHLPVKNADFMGFNHSKTVKHTILPSGNLSQFAMEKHHFVEIIYKLSHFPYAKLRESVPSGYLT